jgi:CRISPR/Cas system CMR subunit Cmr4 (Cas7 group RAMP superfamily)
MKTDSCRLELHLESPVLIGSGEGWGSVIDTDVVFDEVGLPFIPARRVKGVLRESTLELLEMFVISGITGYSKTDLETSFGKS